MTGATDKSVSQEVMRYCIPCNLIHSLDWCNRNGNTCTYCEKELIPAVLETVKTVRIITQPQKVIKRMKG